MAVLAAPLVRGDEVRTWTDARGKTIQAEFVRVQNGQVTLKQNGRVVNVPLDRFSAADQEHIRSRAKGDAAVKAPGNANDKKAVAADQAAKAAAAELRETREWKDRAGRSIRARFTRFFGRQVVLAQGNKMHRVDFSVLSAADQEFLQSNFAALGKQDEVPRIAVAQREPNRDLAQGSAVVASTSEGTDPATSPPAMRTNMPFPFPPTAPGAADLASQIQVRQEEARARHEQMRASIEKMREEMRAARERTPRPTVPQPAPTSPVAATTGSEPPAPNHALAHAPSEPIVRQPIINETPSPIRPGRDKTPASPFANSPIASHDDGIGTCSNCGKEVSGKYGAGDHCPHCGIYFAEETDEHGRTIAKKDPPWYENLSGRKIKGIIFLVILVCSIIGGLIAKMRGS
jgi:hypothetical protein